MLVLHDDPEREIRTYYASRFGIPDPFLASLDMSVNRDEVWGGTGQSLPGIRTIRPMGLRIGRSFPREIKPTSTFLMALGPLVTRSVVNVTREELRELLLGHRIPCLHGDTGYVALAHRGDILGCGRRQRGKLQALIPTGRRKELLDILEQRPHP